MKENEEIKLTIEKFDHDGRGIAYFDNKIVFVDNSVPGDVVLVSIYKNKKKYCCAKVNKYIEYSSYRINPLCSKCNECGGCDLQNISYSKQLDFKEDKIREILSKFANLQSKIIKPILALKDNNFMYRNKITFQVKKNIGMYCKNTYDLVSIDKCYLVDDSINKILNIINDNIKLDNVHQIVIRKSFYNSEIMVIFVGNNIFDINIEMLKNSVSSIYIKNSEKYELIYGRKYLEEKIGEYIFKISPDSFFQVNTRMCVKLYDKVLEYGNFSGNEVVLDLYCGTGTIGIYISKYVKKVIGYEINKYAVEDANINKKNNSIKNVDFVCGTSELFYEKIKNDINTIIVDPPRNGLNDKTINAILSVKPTKVIYVSCDPVTLARDLKILGNFFEVVEVTPVDMFPNTKHVECVCVLKHKGKLVNNIL